MTRKNWALLISTSLAMLALTGLVFAGVPAKSKVIKINYIKGKKGTVVFNHAKHASEYKVGGKAITCKRCHHTLIKAVPKKGSSVKGCSKCHVAQSKTPVKFRGKAAPFIAVKKGKKYSKKSVIFHANCIPCHKKVKKTEGKKISGCKTCHKK